MDEHRPVLRIGAWTVALAVFLRLLGTGVLDRLTRLPTDPGTLSLFVYLQTGRKVTLPAKLPVLPLPTPTQPAPTQPTLPETTEPQPTQPPSETGITAEDMSYVNLSYSGNYRPELEPLLLSPLFWDLADGQPRVLILHTHATECYTAAPGESIYLSGDYRTEDPAHNMLSVGEYVAKKLAEGGVGVIHDRTLHDSPSYNDAYVNSRKTVQAYLEKYPTIQLVLDLHRDAAGSGGQQLVTVGSVNGQRSAQLMLVVGTNESGRNHPNWQQNLALALKLTAVLEREDPGLCRNINLRKERFNQDLSVGGLIVEVGAAGNTRQEALLAAGALVEGILKLAKGTAP